MIAVLDRDLNVTNRIRPETMQLNLEERQSTASFTIGTDDPEIDFGTWLRDETDPGAGIIWRVKSVNKQYEKKTKTIQLEHIINTLRDTIIFEELNPAGITGNKSAKTCTAKQAARKVLSMQTLWELGDFEFDVSNPYTFDGDTLLTALETISSSLDGAVWEYDLSKTPFKLHIRKEKPDVACEMRMSRNISGLRMTVDGSRMFTRFYPVGKDDLHVTGNYVQRNTSLYGVICKTETDETLDTKEKLTAWANERLKKHAEPSVTVTISGLELVRATGEALDRLTLNRVCRVPLPEFGTTISEKITKLSWSDKVRDPESVTITLANIREDVAKIISKANKASAKAGKSRAKKNKEDHAWFVDTETHVGMVAEAVAGPGAASDWSRVSSCIVDGDGIHQQVQRTQGDLDTAVSRIDMSEEKIGLVVERKNGQNVIKAASICAAINGDGKSVVQINADKIALTGQTKLNDVLTVLNGMAVFTKPVVFGDASGSASVQSGIMKADGFQIHSGNNKYDIGYSELGAMIKTASASGNTLTLTRWDGTTVNFNRAVTSYNTSWSGGVLTITPVPQGTAQFKVGFATGTDIRLEVATNGTPTASAAGDAWVDAPLAVNEITGQTQPVQRYTVTKQINATPAYNNGKKAATVTLSYGTVTVDSNYQKHLTFSATNDSNTSKKDAMELYLVLGSGKAQLRKTSATGTIIMEINTN